MLLDQRGIFRQRGGKIFNPHAASHRPEAGKFRGEKAVHKHKAVAGQFCEHRRVQRPRFRAVNRGFLRERKRQLRDGRDVGETPVLIAQVREARRRKAGEAGLADRRQPLRMRRGGREPRKCFHQPFRPVMCFLRHV